MGKDHRYPEEIKKDSRDLAAKAYRAEIANLVAQYGRFAVVGAATLISMRSAQEGKQP